MTSSEDQLFDPQPLQPLSGQDTDLLKCTPEAWLWCVEVCVNDYLA